MVNNKAEDSLKKKKGILQTMWITCAVLFKIWKIKKRSSEFDKFFFVFFLLNEIEMYHYAKYYCVVTEGNFHRATKLIDKDLDEKEKIKIKKWIILF